MCLAGAQAGRIEVCVVECKLKTRKVNLRCSLLVLEDVQVYGCLTQQPRNSTPANSYVFCMPSPVPDAVRSVHLYAWVPAATSYARACLSSPGLFATYCLNISSKWAYVACSLRRRLPSATKSRAAVRCSRVGRVSSTSMRRRARSAYARWAKRRRLTTATSARLCVACRMPTSSSACN